MVDNISILDEDNEAAAKQIGSSLRFHSPPDSFPELMTEEEVCLFLRLPEISGSKNYRNVIENLKRMQGFPCIHICKRSLYPLMAVRNWIAEKALREQGG